MKSTKRHFTLEDGEYLITGNHPDAPKYKVFLEGRELKDIVGLIRINIEELKEEEDKNERKSKR